MGGEIRVASEPGRGSTFSFTARFSRGKALEPETEQTLDLDTVAAALGGSLMLIVEDNPVNQQVVREVLEQVGVIVTVAADGRDALAAVATRDGRFDAILMDLQMPEMDGFEATLMIRPQWSADRLPIIAMTAHTRREERERCPAAGTNDHLSKPVNPNRLYACLLQ